MDIDRAQFRDAFIADNATILGDVTIGRKVSIWYGAVIRADKDSVALGDWSNVQDNAVLHTSAGHPVQVGREVSIGHGAILHGCTIRDRVLVGMGAIVLNGACVGEDCLLGAGTVVTEGRDIPPGSVVVGVPGKVVKTVTEEQKDHITRNPANYWELAGRYMHG